MLFISELDYVTLAKVSQRGSHIATHIEKPTDHENYEFFRVWITVTSESISHKCVHVVCI